MKKMSWWMMILLVVSLVVEVAAQNKIEIDPEKNCKAIVKISEIADEINYIPLETKSESLISDLAKIRITDNLIFVKNRNPQSLKAFDYNGNFVTDIGKNGNGPGDTERRRCVGKEALNVLLT